MKPVYFPFTYINDADARNLCGCFGRITVYQPVGKKIPENMRKLSDEGVLELKTPVPGDEERILALIKEYEEWGDLHQKSDMAFLKAIGERAPFFDETLSTELASQIKRIRDGNDIKEKPDILFNARLFLSLAQDFDIMQEGINRDLISVHEMEKKLLAGLTHEEELYFAEKTGGYLAIDDSGRYKIKERIEAWTYLMANDTEPPRFFVTCNRDAFDFIIEKTADIKNIIEIDSRKVCDFHPSKEPAGDFSFKLYGIINKSRFDFMKKMLGEELQNDIIKDNSGINKSIFICLSEILPAT